MNNINYRIVNRSKLDSVTKHLFNSFKDHFIFNGWIAVDDKHPDKISISTNFITELTDDLYELNREISPTEETFEQFEQLTVQLSVLRGLLKPSKKCVYINQKGLIEIGRSQLTISLLVDDRDTTSGSELASVNEILNADLDPLLISVGLEILGSARTTHAQLRAVRKLKTLRKIDLIAESAIKLSQSVERLTVSDVSRVYPILKQKAQSNNGVFELTAKIVDENSREHIVDPARIDLKEKVVKLDNFNFLPIEENVGTVFDRIKENEVLMSDEVVSHLADPIKIFGEGFDPNIVDLSEYSSRVLGFEEIKIEKIIDSGSGIQWYKNDDDRLYFTARNINGETVSVPVDDPVKLKFIATEFAEKLKNLDEEEPPSTVDVGGYKIPVNEGNTKKIKEVCDELFAEKTAQIKDKMLGEKRKAAIIKEKDLPGQAVTTLSYTEVSESEIAPLLNGKLDPHQYDGVSWLNAHFKNEKGGVLLADDMGLGKTLQILTFLSLVSKDEKNQIGGKFQRPVLIVAPKILLENWKKESQKFMKSNFFDNVLVFHDKKVHGFLDEMNHVKLEIISRFNIILTTYTTFASYQQSLLKVPFSVAIFDESQAIKNPDTASARAARGLKDAYTICCTGTPVENSYLDLWAQIDAANRKPAHPMGRKKDYSSGVNSNVDVKQIKSFLGYPEKGGIVKRREKSILVGLPEKVIHPLSLIEMTKEQVAMQKEIVSIYGKKKLKVLQHLQALYQHPRMLEDTDIGATLSASAASLIGESPKLKLTMDLVNNIKLKNEKVLVFTLWSKMQLILQKVFREIYGIDVNIINGETNASTREDQKALNVIDRFSQKDGFNILILSPLAAGAGLNITAANNVIHYGRWWNPAKEDQATDRAYRKGQTKAVNVYYPTLDKNGDEESFDLNLSLLVEKKRELASDFLSISGPSDLSNEEVNEALKKGQEK